MDKSEKSNLENAAINQYIASTPLAQDVLTCLRDADSLTKEALISESLGVGGRESTDHNRVRIAIRLQIEVLPKLIAADYVVIDANEYTVGFLPAAVYEVLEDR